MNKEDKLGTESIFKLCLVMGIPAILAQLVNLLYSIVDRIYIGNMAGVGEIALGSLGLCMPIITLISAFSAFVSGGGAPLAAKALGEQNKDKARKYLGNGFTILITFSIILSIVTYVFMEDILLLIGASDGNLGYAMDYLSIYLIGTIFVQFSVGLNTFITAQGRSGVAMCSVLIGAIINIILDPILIFGFNMGISGAALATIISQFVSAVWVLCFLFNKKNVLHIEIKKMKLESSICKGIFCLGIASFVMTATESVIGFVLNRGLRDYGGVDGDLYVSLLTVLQSVMLFITVPISGFTQGITPIISYNYGAHNRERLITTFKITAITCVLYSTLFTVIVWLVPGVFGRMFTSNEQLITLTEKLLPIFLLGMPIFGLQRACQTTFVALGQSVISLFIATLRKIILLVPISMILPIYYGVESIFYAEPIADVTAAIICGTAFFIIFRKILSNMKNQEILEQHATNYEN